MKYIKTFDELTIEINARLYNAKEATQEAKNDIVKSYGQGYEAALQWVLDLIKEN